MTQIIQDSDEIEVCSKTKCPYRRMYATNFLTGSIAPFSIHNLFKNCKNCTGFGFYRDAEKKRGIECPIYPLLIDARQFVREQTSRRQASFAAADAAGD